MRRTPAGWYADTSGSPSERWFDGVSWTVLTRPREGSRHDTARPWWTVVAAGAVVVLVVAAPLLLSLAPA